MSTAASTIQLGVLVLETFLYPEGFHPRHLQQLDGWDELNSESCQSYYNYDSDRAVILALQGLLKHSCGYFGGQYLAIERGTLVRCWVIPDKTGGQFRSSNGDPVVGPLTKWMETISGAVRRGWEDGQGPYLLAPTPEDYMRMSEVYAAVPSPPEPQLSLLAGRQDRAMMTQLMRFKEPDPHGWRHADGLRSATQLHAYQVRSVAKMLQMETHPERLSDPLWAAIAESGREGTFYLNLQTFEVKREAAWYPGVRGGILNEQMGVGKTLMALSLILITLDQNCSPPTLSAGATTTTTDHRTQCFPFSQDHQVRAQIHFDQAKTKLSIPSLVELCVDVLARRRPAVDRSFATLATLGRRLTHLEDHVRARLPLYHEIHVDEILDEECSRTSKGIKTPQKRMYLANTTLVVCPTNLVHQWMEEVEKHIEEGSLRVLRVKESPLPGIKTLLQYDIILMSVELFAAENRVTGTSVLEQARWKRIFLDEGHSAGKSRTSNAMILAAKLSIERRWAVSGTPTRNLQQGGELELGSTEESPSSPSYRRPWSTKEIADVTSLGLIIGNFLAADPFRSDSGFQKIITSALKPEMKSGVTPFPSFGAVPRLRNLLSSFMVKHQPQVIDLETQLPPCVIRTELLHFHPMQRVTYNALCALIASNVYTSGYNTEDQPGKVAIPKECKTCLLHPHSATLYHQAVRNLHLACFWYSAPKMGTDDCLLRIRDYLKVFDFAPEVRARLEEAAQHLETAAVTEGWREWMENAISLPFECHDLDVFVRKAWSDSPNRPDAIDTSSLMQLQDANRRGALGMDLIAQGCANGVFKLGLLAVDDEEGQAKKRAKGGADDHASSTAANLPPSSLKKLPAGKSKKFKPRKESALNRQLAEAAENARRSNTSHLPRPLPDAFRTSSRSTKIDFTLQTILDSDAEDKFVIFGATIELGHLTEALDVFEIKSCYVGPGISKAKREEALKTFREPSIKVCLLNLNFAAFGLNLVAANRMILLSPIWSPDLKAQVIKRIQRLGQTRPTMVQVLAIKGTFEEDIANREPSQCTVEAEKLYSRVMIENPRFVYDEDADYPADKFTVNLIPATERVQPETTPPPPDLDASNPSSPDSPMLDTPHRTSSMGQDLWLSEDADDEAVMTRNKRDAEDMIEDRPEKRVKGVTFA